MPFTKFDDTKIMLTAITIMQTDRTNPLNSLERDKPGSPAFRPRHRAEPDIFDNLLRS
ncbi:hypothetical protein SY94_6139 (plasmid) [Agrobacterium tumefaciens]|nr:hypothetical protein SY94_6139 [Agrobacterium tumefaciens]